MLARVWSTSAATVAKRALVTNNIRLIDSRRHASHGGEVQHADHHGHDDQYRLLYERMWRYKATLDWLPKPEGSWEEVNGKKQAYYNKVLVSGIVALLFSAFYFRTVVIGDAKAYSKPPYHLIGHEDFPGSKYEDAGKAK